MSLPTSVDRTAEADSIGETVTIRVASLLDSVAGPALVDTLRAELDRAPCRVDIDLGGLHDYTEEGLDALASCRTLGTGLTGGLHYRTEGGAGQDALLAAFALQGEPDGPDEGEHHQH
ncbi:MAG: hypothetical protein ACR2LQ_00270 [Acidimicrobiales bacterium]